MMSEHLAVLLLSNTGAHLVISLGTKPIGECRVIYCSVTTVLVLLCQFCRLGAGSSCVITLKVFVTLSMRVRAVQLAPHICTRVYAYILSGHCVFYT